jgi:hypothetical protein
MNSTDPTARPSAEPVRSVVRPETGLGQRLAFEALTPGIEYAYRCASGRHQGAAPGYFRTARRGAPRPIVAPAQASAGAVVLIPMSAPVAAGGAPAADELAAVGMAFL